MSKYKDRSRRRVKPIQPVLLRGCGTMPFPGGENPVSVLMSRTRLHTVAEWVRWGRPLYLIRWAERPHGGSKVTYVFARTFTPTYLPYFGLVAVPHRAEGVWVGALLPPPPGDHEPGWCLDPASWEDAPDQLKALGRVAKRFPLEARVRSWDRVVTEADAQQYMNPGNGMPWPTPITAPLGIGIYDPDRSGAMGKELCEYIRDRDQKRKPPAGPPMPAA